jgi:hypothetical protein
MNTDSIKLTPPLLKKRINLWGKQQKDKKVLDIKLATAEACSTKNILVHIAVGNYI